MLNLPRQANKGVPSVYQASLNIIVLVIIAVMLLSGGQHGPARHLGLGAPPQSPVARQAMELQHSSSLA